MYGLNRPCCRLIPKTEIWEEHIINAKSYNVQTSANGNGNGNGTWTDAGIYTQARRIVLGNLTPGMTYNVRARAIGGSTGTSDWSAPVSLMAT